MTYYNFVGCNPPSCVSLEPHNKVGLLFLSSPPTSFIHRELTVTVSTEYNTLLNFGLDLWNWISAVNHHRDWIFLAVLMVKFKYPWVTLTTLHTGMSGKILENVFSGYFSNGEFSVFYLL